MISAVVIYYFKCTVNGVALSGTTTMSDGNGAGANISGNFVNEQSQKKSAIIVFAENIGTKGLTTYTSTYTGYQDESGAWWRWKSGTFTITKWDDVKYEVAGTFNSLVFENPNDITKTIEVTDGRFYVMLAH